MFLNIVLHTHGQDSVAINLQADTLPATKEILTPYQSIEKNIIEQNVYLNTQAKAVSNSVSVKKQNPTIPFFFYLLSAIVLCLAVIKFAFAKYFNTLFKVFFNTSLKQSQLTDQLIQAKLPSLLYNILFVIVAGIYVFTLFNYYNVNTTYNKLLLIFFCIMVLAIIYAGKYLTLKFTGWITGFSAATNTYTFVVFLINKILAILLLPLLVFIVFTKPVISQQAVIISYLLIGFMFVLRFFKSYGVLQNQLKVNRLHFFLYIIGIEVLPLLVIYKALILLLGKNP